TFESPWGIASTTTRVLRPSDGTQQLTQDSVVTMHYVGINGTTGEIFDSSYERGTAWTTALATVIPGFRLGLEGQSVGSRVLIGMPSSDGYPEGNQDGSINPGDSLLFVIDIISANFEEVTGEPVEPVEGMPSVTEDNEGVPEATIDTAAEPPAELQVAPLVEGPGAAVTSESVIQVKYRSWVWASGEVFEDAWAPQSGRLEGLIDGWRQGLEGQTAGSRVLLVVPPELAYPEGRTTAPSIEPDQTLVYVIDILDVQNP
ncbi:MAG: peptidylprolyl isomerase, partial [Propionibacterium sp.]|nr:peptidylprolyl isomerase [Propionibacterium sp.]